MPNLLETVRIPLEADTLWREIGPFGAVGDWHPMLAKVDSEGDIVGAIRTAHAMDGSTQVERLQAFDANQHIYRYTMESTPMPVHDYVGEFRIDDNGDGTSMIIWSAQFEVLQDREDEVVQTISGFLKAGTDNLRKQYGEGE